MTCTWKLVLGVLMAFMGCSLTPATAWGWGADGHVIVAKIAELNLEPEARKAIAKLLGPIPISSQRIATYADFVKHNPDFPQFKESPPWHFVDIPLGETFDPAKHCKDGTCVVGKIEEFRKTLADTTQPADKRLEALMFLVHLVGDMHQPLHCATRDDQGGNGLKVRFLGQSGNHLNLHSVWDDNLVRANLGGLEPGDYANRLDNTIKAPDRKQWQTGTVEDWAAQAHEQAEKSAYRDGAGAPLPTTGHPNLNEAYVKRNKAVVAVQLQKGGIRLAKILNDALAPAP